MSSSNRQMSPPSVAASQRTVKLFGIVNRVKRWKTISHDQKRLLQRIDSSLRTLTGGGWKTLDRVDYPGSRVTYPEQLRLTLEGVEDHGSEESWRNLKVVFDAFSAEASFQRVLLRLRQYIEEFPAYNSMPKTSCMRDTLHSLSTDQIRVLHRHQLEIDGESLAGSQQLLNYLLDLDELKEEHDRLQGKRDVPKEVKSQNVIANMLETVCLSRVSLK
ncbi:hypothetical protein JCM5350_001374 [Sporobolomyces pararoseus]